MKTISIFCLISLLVFSCSTNSQKKAEKSIQDYLTINLNNPKTYSPVEFSEVDTVTQSDTLLQYCKKIIELINEEKEAQKRIERLVEIRFEYDKSDDEQFYLKRNRATIDSLEKVKNSLNELASTTDAQNNLVYYEISHKYSHKGKDNENVELSIDFLLDRDFTVLPNKITKGINGQANFTIKIMSKDGGYYYTEFVIDPKMDGQLINSNGLTELTLKAGKHYLTWTASNKNGFGVLTSPETFRQEVILEDSPYLQSFFIINGKSYFSYKDEEEAINDSFYQEYIIKK